MDSKFRHFFTVLKVAIIMMATLFSAPAISSQPEICHRFYRGENYVIVNDLRGVSNLYDPWRRVIEDANGEPMLIPSNGRLESHIMLPDGRISRPTILPYLEFSGLSHFWPSMLFHNDGLLKIYSGYGPNIADKIVEMVKEVERIIAVARTSTFSVSAKHSTDDILGFFRVFDGTDYGGGGAIHKYESNYTMPLEYMLKFFGIKEVPIINQDRKDKNSIFELGKYFIDPKVPPEIKLALKNMIYSWLEYTIMQPQHEETFFYAHVATETHRKAFKKEFGLEPVLDPKLNGGLQPPQYILRAPLHVFRKKIRDHLLEKGLLFY